MSDLLSLTAWLFAADYAPLGVESGLAGLTLQSLTAARLQVVASCRHMDRTPLLDMPHYGLLYTE